MTFNQDTIFKKENINLNTVVAVAGFLGMFAAFIATWTTMQNKQEETQKWQEAHMDAHAKWQTEAMTRYAGIVTRMDGMQLTLNKQDQIDYRLAQTEKFQDVLDTRIGRVSESYTNQLTEVRSQLSSMATQLALANDSLKRLESLDRTPRELR